MRVFIEFATRRPKKGLDARNDFVKMTQLALPNRNDLPAKSFKLRAIASISTNCGAPFVAPELRIGRRSHAAPFAIVRMPEAAIDKDRLFALREREIGFAGKRLRVKRVPVTAGMKPASQRDFRLRIAWLDGGHVPSSLLGAQVVRHGPIVLEYSNSIPYYEPELGHTNESRAWLGSKEHRESSAELPSGSRKRGAI